MLPEELIRKVRRIELATRKMVDDMMSGQFRSHFKGQGVQFSEHRLYVPGDDIRHIDWKVSARTRDPLIKKYEEERELTVLLVIDVSGSGMFGSSSKLKSEIAAEISGMLAYAAIHTGDKVGALLFSSEVEEIIPPKKGKKHIMRIIRDVLAYKPRHRGTNLPVAIESARRMLRTGGIVFVISDFVSDEEYGVPLGRLARRHDVVAIRINDPREKDIPSLGRFLFQDPETGEESYVDTGSYSFKKWLKESRARLDERWEGSMRRARIEKLNIATQEDYGEAVVRFFRARSQRRR